MTTIPETIAALRNARSRETHLYVTGAGPKLSSMSSEIPNVSKEDLAKIADLIDAVRRRIDAEIMFLKLKGTPDKDEAKRHFLIAMKRENECFAALEQTEPEKEK